MRILDRYIRKNIIYSILIVLMILMAIQCFLGFVGEVSFIGKGTYGLKESLEYVFLTLPYNLYQIFPMVGFIGCLIGLGKLASDSELVIIRGAGVSVGRLIVSVIKATLIMIVIMTMIGEWIGPKLNYMASNIKGEAIHGSSYKNLEKVWLRNGNLFIFVESSPDAEHIKDVVIYDFSSEHKLLSASHADYGVLHHKKWELFNIHKTLFLKNVVHSERIDHELMNFHFKPKMERQVLNDVDNETMWQLMKSIEYRKNLGELTNQYQLKFCQRIVRPLTTLVLVCLGVPFVFGSLRNASWGLRILVGVLIGFSFQVLNEIFGPIIMVYQVSPAVGALLPTAVFVSVYLIIFKRSYL